jgi:hypothetical protein
MTPTLELLEKLSSIYKYGIIKVKGIETAVPYNYVRKKDLLRLLSKKDRKVFYNHKKLDSSYTNDRDEKIYLVFEVTEFILHYMNMCDIITLKIMLEKKRLEFDASTKQQTDQTIKSRKIYEKLQSYLTKKWPRRPRDSQQR